MPNSHHPSLRQFNNWLHHELLAAIKARAKKEGLPLATLARQLLHAHFSKECPYRQELYDNKGGWNTKKRSQKTKKVIKP